MKSCIKCGVMKPLDDYYAHRAMKDGHLNKCRSCCLEYINKRREQHGDEIRAYDRSRGNLPHRIEARRRYAETEAGKEAIKRAKAAYTKRYPEKKRANMALRNAILTGRVLKLPCFVCGCDKVEAHHVAYDLPLDVVWLCPTHHKQTHKEHRRRMESVNSLEYGQQEAA